MASSTTAVIKPYTIEVPDAKVQRLKQKLEAADLPEEIDDEGPWSRGPPIADIERLVTHWKDKFDWRKVEAKLNELPQYTASIEVDGYGKYEVHFVYKESTCKNAVPLLFLHGWPGSFIEVTKILPQLVQGGEDFPAFHVVAPSLIDFGFSDRSGKKGFHSKQHGEVGHKLMQILGFNQYVVQGGDIGAFVARNMVQHYKSSIKAHHINLARLTEPTLTEHPALYAQIKATPLTAQEKAGFERSKWFETEGRAYSLEHATKPQTIGYSLTDSPVGLLAWIYEKLHDWTDDYPWTDDEVLTWVSIYYFSKPGVGQAQKIYYESMHYDQREGQNYSEVPLGFAHFPKELMHFPKLWYHALGPLVLWSEQESGGHFAAWERPEALVKDLRDMLKRDGPVYGCVEGRNGYDAV